MRKITFLFLLFLSCWSGLAQFGCSSAVILTDGYTANGITTPGTGGAEDWNANPTGTSINASYWDDDVYLFEYTSGATSEMISMTIFSRNGWNGIGIFDTCTGTTFSGELDADSATGVNTSKTVTAVIAASTTVYIAVGQWGTPNDLDFDVTDFSVATCLVPENVQNTSVTDASADFSWDTQASATTGYNWVVMADGDDPLVDTPVTSGSVSTGATSANATSLSSNTDYDFYVQSDCGGGDLSDWSSVVSFTTNCATFSTPFNEDFEAAAGSIPDCWSESGGEDWEFANSVGSDHIGDDGDFGGTTSLSGGYWAFVDDSNTSSTTPSSSLTTPFIDVSSLTVPALSFYELSHNEGNANSTLDVEVYDGAAWNNIATYNTNTNGWEERLIDFSNLTITGDIQIRFTVTDSGSFYDDIAIDDVAVIEMPTCFRPVNAQNTALTDTTADFSWDTEATATTGYNWVVMADGDDPDTGTPVDSGSVVSGTTTANSTGLSSNTDYDFYVQSDCGGGDLSFWSVKLDFLTNCAAFTLPVCENFDMTATGGTTNPSTPGCWSFIDSGSGYGYTRASTPNSSPNSFYLYNSSDSSGDYILVSPQITNVTNGNNWIDFWVDGGNNQTIIVGSMSDPTDATTFTAIQTITLTSSDYENHQVNIPSGTDEYIGLKHGQVGTFDSYYIDDICIEEIPSCIDPSNLDVASITTTSADLSWDDNNTPAATTWDIEYGVAPYTPTGTPSTGLDDVTTNPYNLTGLSDNTTYEYYVRSDCGSDNTDVSEWVGPFTFTTECGVLSAPYTEDFTDPNIPNCWEQDAANDWEFDGSISWNTSGCSASPSDHTTGGGGNFAAVDMTNTSDGTSVILEMPLIDVSTLTKPALYFHMFMCTQGYSPVNELHVDAYDGTNWNSVGVVNTGSASWEEHIFLLAPYAVNDIVQLRFRSEESTATFSYYGDIAIDDVIIDEGPSCPIPSNIVNDGVNSTDAAFTWDPVPSAVGYDWVVMADGDDPLTDTPIASGSTTAANNRVVVPGLNSSTDYDFYVRSDCGNGDVSGWSSQINFATECAIVIAPFFDDIESHAPTSAFDESECWYTVQTSYDWNISDDDTPSTGTGPNQAYSGTNFFFTEGSSGSTGDVAELYSPMIDVSSLTNPALIFYYHMFNGSTPGDMGELHVDVYAGNTWNNDVMPPLVGTQQTAQTDPWIEKFVDLSSYTGTIQIRFRAIRGNDYESDISIDDVRIEEAPTCFTPGNIQVINTNDTTADFSWDAEATATNGYIWVVMADGDDPLTDTPVASGTTPAGTTTANVTGLSASTDYDFYVKSDCGGGDESEWSSGLDFSTTCATYIAPFIEDFDTAAGSLPNCWSMSGGEDWEFANTVGIDHIGNDGDFAGTTSDSGGYWAFIDDSGSDAPSTLTSPFIDVSNLTTPALSFFEISHNEGNANATLDVEVYDGSAWNNVGTYNTNTNGWEEKLIDLSNLNITGDIQVRFTITDSGSFYDDIAIDDVRVDEFPTCFDPENIQLNNYTATTADFSWDAEPTATNGYNWVVMADGDNPNVDTPIASGTVPAGTTTANVSGLSASTDYDFYVKSDCGAGDLSQWSPVFDFTTYPPCAAPTNVQNTAVTDTTADFTWDASSDESDGYNWVVMLDGDDPITDTPFTSGSTASGITIVAVTGLDDNTEYDFYVRSNCGNGNFSQWSTGVDFKTEFGPCIPPTAINTGTTDTTADFQWLESVDETDGYNWVVMADGDDPENDTPVQQGSVANGITTLTVTGLDQDTMYDFYLQSNCGGGNIGGWSTVVNFTTELGPCGVPMDITNDSVTTNSATFSWSDPAELTTGFVWKVVANGGDPSTNTPVDQGYVQAGTSSITVSGLLSNISYDFYIRSDCGNGNVSDWSQTLDFSTSELGVSAEQFEGFEYYPNPVKSTLSLSASFQIEQVVVYNLLGQKVNQLTPNTLTTEVNMDRLPAATYLVSVTIDGQVKTFRVIKE